MTYVIAAPCVADYSCVEVCPVDAISPEPKDKEFADQLYIDPEVCIDCAVCEFACPVNAIFREDKLPKTWQHYTALNREYFQQR